MNYSNLLGSANTPRQIEVIEACIDAGTQKEAAALLGVNVRTLERCLQRINDCRKSMELESPTSHSGRTHCMIPDCQVTPDTPTDHMGWIGQYLADIQPDVIVNIGDFADMESLSSYDFGKKAAEGRRVIQDFDCANKAMIDMMKPINSDKSYNPELHMTLGNHEHRINRVVDSDAKLDGFLSIDSLNYKDMGYEVHDFLTPVEIDGVTYIHFVPNMGNGKPMGGASMDTRLKNIGYSFSQGHQQVHMTGLRALTNGTIHRGLVSGTCYLHDEDYRGKTGNTSWRGIIVKHEVFDGNYDIMEVSLDYLCRKYERMPLSRFMSVKYPDIFHESIWLQRLAYRDQLMRAA